MERPAPEQRVALVGALNAFNEAGGESPASTEGDPEPCPFGRTADATVVRDA
ncbi:hypothetical protein GCM10010358_42940 [Streptomyces minutiscleroticus]|uniref:Uncharacterized protein n=1 Tax=Streptomyces minutiscleroticus TaxID=68238 RepID=A0A918NNY4_9ACTN|nr:hypothetical protein GCM10010358_42940 [Streptomyces minutiscleroticus]